MRNGSQRRAPDSSRLIHSGIFLYTFIFLFLETISGNNIPLSLLPGGDRDDPLYRVLRAVENVAAQQRIQGEQLQQMDHRMAGEVAAQESGEELGLPLQTMEAFRNLEAAVSRASVAQSLVSLIIFLIIILIILSI